MTSGTLDSAVRAEFPSSPPIKAEFCRFTHKPAANCSSRALLLELGRQTIGADLFVADEIGQTDPVIAAVFLEGHIDTRG